MKASIYAALTSVLIATAAQAGSPGIVTLTGELHKVTNPNRKCAASVYAMVVGGTYTDSKGTTQSAQGCLEGVAVPLSHAANLRLPDPAGASYAPFDLTLAVLKHYGGLPKMTMQFAVEDTDNVDIATAVLLSIK